MSYIKCMIIVCLTTFSSILSDSELHKVHHYCVFDYFFSISSPFLASELPKVHDYCVFVNDCFLFNLVTISVCELHKVHDYCVFDCFLVTIIFRE